MGDVSGILVDKGDYTASGIIPRKYLEEKRRIYFQHEIFAHIFAYVAGGVDGIGSEKHKVANLCREKLAVNAYLENALGDVYELNGGVDVGSGNDARAVFLLAEKFDAVLFKKWLVALLIKIGHIYL